MLAKILKCAGIGFLIGAVVGNLIAVLTSTSSSEGVNITSQQLLDMAGGSPAVSILLQSLFSGLYGSLCFVGITFYDIERWPLALATALHCAVIVLTFIPIALLLGWFTSIVSLLIMSCIQIVAFFIIWLILYFSYKKQIKELNELMNRNKEKK